MKDALFPNRVKEFRIVTSRGELSQQDLAARAGISAGALSAIEDQRVSPKTSTALAIARALGLTLDDLFLPSALADQAKDSEDADGEPDAVASPTEPSTVSLASIPQDRTAENGGPGK